MVLRDNYGRTAVNLRLALTDQCNMRCRYCMPAEGVTFLPERELLTFDEIERVVRVAAKLGIRKVRLTGGEPLARPSVPELIRRLMGVPGIADLGLTTNGYFLAEQADRLHAAGLRRINVSLDSLDRERFRRITGRDALERVLAGLEAAERAGFRPIKVNVVAMHDCTETEVLQFAALARRKPYQVRFIEFMPLDGDRAWHEGAVLPGREIVARIHARWPLEPLSPNGHVEPATLFRFADGAGEVGIIPTVTEPFCERCNRVRLTADGKLRACLFAHEETDLRALLRAGGAEEQIAGAFRQTVAGKGPGHCIGEPGFRRPQRDMWAIGG